MIAQRQPAQRQAEILKVDFSRNKAPSPPPRGGRRLRYQISRTLTVWSLAVAGCSLALGLFLSLIYLFL